MREFAIQHVPKPNLAFNGEFFARPEPVDLEIGAGQGLHAIRYAQAHPERRLIAIERTHARFQALTQRFDQHARPENLRIAHANAMNFVAHFVPPRSLDRVFLLYPNPYPKSRQANLRWHNSPFIGHLRAKMKPCAELTLATNLEWYAAEACRVFERQWQFEVADFTLLDAHHVPRTHFEKKYLARGERCWNLVLRAPGEPG